MTMNELYRQAMDAFNRKVSALSVVQGQQATIMRMSSRIPQRYDAEMPQTQQESRFARSEAETRLAPPVEVSSPPLEELKAAIARAQKRIFDLATETESAELGDTLEPQFIERVFMLFFPMSTGKSEFASRMQGLTLESAYEVAMVSELFPYERYFEQVSFQQDSIEAEYADVLRAYAWLAPLAQEHRTTERSEPERHQLKYEEFTFKPKLLTDQRKTDDARAASLTRLNLVLPDGEKLSSQADFIQRVEAQQKVREIKLAELREAKERAELEQLQPAERFKRHKAVSGENSTFDHFLETQSKFLEAKKERKPDDEPECTFRPKISRKPVGRPENQEILGYEKAVERQQRARKNRAEEDPEQAFERLRERTKRAGNAEIKGKTAVAAKRAVNGVTVQERPRQREILRRAQISVPGSRQIIVSFYENDSIDRILNSIGSIFTLTPDERESFKKELEKEFGDIAGVEEDSGPDIDPYDQLFNCQQGAFYIEVREAILGQSAQIPLERAVVIDEEDQFFY